MPFPEVERVLYKKNPLTQVICQLRFPPILRVDAEVPAAFQERVRHFFPGFSETAEWNVDVPPDVNAQVPPELLRRVLQSAGVKNYQFETEDKEWKINLSRTFVALSSASYGRWEEFKERLQLPLAALIEIYGPEYFSRIGLRYVNVIDRTELGLAEVPWAELLRPYVLGIVGSPEAGEYVSNFESRCEVGLSDHLSVVRIVTKFVQEATSTTPYVAQSKDGVICFMIDNDFFTRAKTEINAVWDKLDYLNERASRLIQWCITQRLHEAMEPERL